MNSAKPKKNRKRNIGINFRTTEEEQRQIMARIEVCGMAKAEFFIQSLLHQKIEIVAGKYKSDRLSLEINKMSEKLDNIINCSDTETLETLRDCKALLSQIKEIIN